MENDTMTDRSDQIVTAFAEVLLSQQNRIAARVAELQAKRRPSAAEREELAILTYSGTAPRRVAFSDEVPF